MIMKKPQLFMLHFAGGSCYSYQFMEPLLREFEVITLELPGRGKRMKEKLVRHFDDAAGDVYRQLTSKLKSPDFLIYGHSMGAYLGLRVAGILERHGMSPACLVVSGNAGPGISIDKKRYQMPSHELALELERLGGVPPGLTGNDELFSFFEPILRADFEIAEKNGMTDERPINIPIYAMMGDLEERKVEIGNWGKFTKAGFHCEIIPGGHFFIYEQQVYVAGVISACYARFAGACYQKNYSWKS
jgi:external thioesterase TEII